MIGTAKYTCDACATDTRIHAYVHTFPGRWACRDRKQLRRVRRAHAHRHKAGHSISTPLVTLNLLAGRIPAGGEEKEGAATW